MNSPGVTVKFKLNCETCGRNFSLKSALRRHLKRSNCGYEECSECKRVFKRTGMKKHKINCVSLTCEVCGDYFQTKWQLNAHQAKHTGATRVDCSKCGTSLYNKDALQRHLNRCVGKIRNQIGRLVKCDLCGSSVPATFRFYHFARCHISLGRGFYKDRFTKCGTITCSYCLQDVSLENYALHRNMEFEQYYYHKINTAVRCEICNYSCLRENLVYHTVVHKSLEDVQKESIEWLISGPTCIFCGVVMKRYACLELHMQVHTKEKPYSCNVCNESFVQKKHLTVHQKKKKHLSNSDDKHNVESQYCADKENGNKSASRGADKNMFCEVCKNTFKRRATYEGHFSYCGKACHICNKKNFRSAKDRRNHLVNHITNQGYECSYCKKRFYKLDEYRYHRRRFCRSRNFKFSCIFCIKQGEFKSTDPEETLSHVVSCDATSNATMNCMICNVRNLCSKNYKTHLIPELLGTRFFDGVACNYNCKKCGLTFPTNELLISHTNVSHKDCSILKLDPMYLCNNCGFFSADQNDVLLHLRNEHHLVIPDHIKGNMENEDHHAKDAPVINGLAKIHRCCFCSMSFYSKMVAMDHMNMCQRKLGVRREVEDIKSTVDGSDDNKLMKPERARILECVANDLKKRSKNVGSKAYLKELSKLVGRSVENLENWMGISNLNGNKSTNSDSKMNDSIQ